MPQHGDYDQDSKRWYCEYWMSLQEWNEVHHYSPSNTIVAEEKEDENNNWKNYGRKEWKAENNVLQKKLLRLTHLDDNMI